MQRNSFFGGVGYKIGGHHYSFNDLEHGVLRGNKVPTFQLSPQLPKDDPRLPAVFAAPDCRIHFALNCGAVSCPAISLYTAQGIDTELDVAAAGFCESADGVAVDAESRTLWLSKLLSWYGADFGRNKREIATNICTWLRGECPRTTHHHIIYFRTMSCSRVLARILGLACALQATPPSLLPSILFRLIFSSC